MHQKNKVKGFTIVELMIVIAIAAILLALAVPSFQQAIAISRLRTTTDQMIASLNGARSEALKTGSRVTICRANSAITQCETNATLGWQTGWLQFNDKTRVEPNASIDTDENVTLVQQTLSNGIIIKGRDSAAFYVSFASDGRPKKLEGAPSASVIRVCSTSNALQDNDRARDITIALSGRISVTTPIGVVVACPAPV